MKDLFTYGLIAGVLFLLLKEQIMDALSPETTASAPTSALVPSLAPEPPPAQPPKGFPPTWDNVFITDYETGPTAPDRRIRRLF